MALRRTEPQWKEFLTNAGIDDDAACTTYAHAFVENGLTETSIPLLDKETLTELIINEVIEIFVPFAFVITYTISYYGPNAAILGNIGNDYWHFKKVHDPHCCFNFF